MKKTLFALSALFLTIACSDQDEKLDKPSGDPVTLTVVVNGAEQKTVLSDYKDSEKIKNGDKTLVSVETILTKTLKDKKTDAEFAEWLKNSFCDYESGSDGFRPSSKSKCPPAPCLTGKAATVNLSDLQLTFDTAKWMNLWVEAGKEKPSAMSGCYNVKSLAKIHVCDTAEACTAKAKKKTERK